MFRQACDARISPGDQHKIKTNGFNNDNRSLGIKQTEMAKDGGSSMNDQIFHYSASSVESLPSASGSSE